MDMARDLEIYLGEQVKELDRLKVPVCFDAITAAYILNLLALSRKNGINTSDAYAATTSIFPDTEDYRALITGAFQLLDSDRQARSKLGALAVLAQSETSAGRYEFLVRHSKKACAAIEALYEPDPDWDPRNEPPWSPEDLA